MNEFELQYVGFSLVLKDSAIAVGQNNTSVYTSPKYCIVCRYRDVSPQSKVIQNQGVPSRMYLKSVHASILKVQIVDIDCTKAI